MEEEKREGECEKEWRQEQWKEEEEEEDGAEEWERMRKTRKTQ